MEPPKNRKSLRKKAEKGDQRAIKRLEEIVYPKSLILFDALLALNASRQSIGGEPQPISYSDMHAYAQMNGFNRQMSLRLQNAVRCAEEELINGDSTS